MTTTTTTTSDRRSRARADYNPRTDPAWRAEAASLAGQGYNGFVFDRPERVTRTVPAEHSARNLMWGSDVNVNFLASNAAGLVEAQLGDFATMFARIVPDGDRIAAAFTFTLTDGTYHTVTVRAIGTFTIYVDNGAPVVAANDPIDVADQIIDALIELVD